MKTKQVGAPIKTTLSVKVKRFIIALGRKLGEKKPNSDEGHEGKKIKLINFLIKRNKISCKWILCLDIKQLIIINPM